MRAGRYSGSARRSPSGAGAGKMGRVAMVTDYGMLNNDARRVDAAIRLPQGGDHAVAAPRCRPQIYEQNLVFDVMDDRRQLGPQPDQVRRRKLAFEDRVL